MLPIFVANCHPTLGYIDYDDDDDILTYCYFWQVQCVEALSILVSLEEEVNPEIRFIVAKNLCLLVNYVELSATFVDPQKSIDTSAASLSLLSPGNNHQTVFKKVSIRKRRPHSI